jgi:phage-related protein
MADTTVDKVKIEIEASAKKAGDSIDKLIENLSVLRDATGNIETTKLYELSGAITSLAEGMKNMPKSSAFTSLAKGIERINQIDTSGLSTIADNISSLANVDAEKLTDLCISMTDFTESMRDVPSAKSFERLATGLDRLNGTDTSNIRNISDSISGLAESVSALNASGINDVRINVRTGGATATDMTPQTENTTADMEQLVNVSEEVQNAVDGMTDSMEETASSENQAGQATSTLADRLGALQEKWREIEDTFTAKDIISGTIYKMNSTVINGFSSMVSNVKGALGNLGSTVSSAVQNIGATVQSIPASLQYAAYNMKSSVSYMGASIKDALTHPISTAIGGMRSLVQAAGSVRNALGNINLSGVQGALLKVAQIAGGVAKTALHTFASAMRKAGNAAKTLMSKAAGATKRIVSMAASLKNSHSLFGKFTEKIKGAGTALSGLSSKLGKVTRLFTFMLLRKAITAMFEELGTAFQHLAQKSSSFNTQISSLMAACSNFSHQIAAMTAPLLDLFGPALTKIINLLSTATSYINQFLSALTGKSVFTSAKKQNYDYAASLEDVGSTAKQTAKEIRDATVGIDELNIISQNDDDSSSGGGSTDDLEDCYEEMAINQKILDLVQQLKDLLAELFQPMKQAWDDYGQGVVDALNYALTSCKNLIIDMGKTWAEVWLNGSGYELCSNILLLLTSILNWIGDIATAWDAAWKEKGEDYVQSKFDKLNAILSLITTISESFRTAWNSGSGQEMIEHIYQILTNCNNIVANLANGFKDAWAEAGVGDGIAQAIFDIFNLVLETIEKITGSTSEWAANLNFTPLLTSVKNLLEKVKPLVEKIGDALSWVWENVILPLGSWAIETALPAVIDAVAAAFDALDAVFEVLKPIFKWIWDHMLKPLAEWTGGTIVEIIEGITSVFEGISEVFKKISDGEDWGEIGKYIWEGLINGIKNVGSWIWEKLTDAFWGIVDFVKDLFGIHSPSTVFEEIGGYLVEGLLAGITGFAETCAEKIGEWVSNIINWFTGGDGEGNIFEKFKGFGSDIVSGFKEKVSGTYTNCKETLTTWGTKVKDWFTGGDGNGNIIEKFKGFAGNIVSGFKDKIGNTYTTVKDNVTTWATSVKDWFYGTGTTLKEKFTEYAGNIVDGFKTKIGNYYSTAQTNMTTWASKVRDWFTGSSYGNVNSTKFQTFASDVIDGFKNKIGNYYTAAQSNIQTWGSKCVSWFEEKSGKSNWETVATNVVDGFKNKIGTLYSSCKSVIQDWASSIVSWFEDKLDINSPSRVFATLGGYTVEGFNRGIDANADSTSSHISDWVEKFDDFTADIGVKFNVKESMDDLDKYKANLDTGFSADTLVKTVRETVNTEGVVRTELDGSGSFKEAMREVAEETLAPLLENIETYTKRQAEKKETTKVYVGDREVAKSVEKQKSANGFSFTPATT